MIVVTCVHQAALFTTGRCTSIVESIVLGSEFRRNDKTKACSPKALLRSEDSDTGTGAIQVLVFLAVRESTLTPPQRRDYSKLGILFTNVVLPQKQTMKRTGMH